MARRSAFLEDLIGGVGLGAGLADMYMEHQSGEAYRNAMNADPGGEAARLSAQDAAEFGLTKAEMPAYAQGAIDSRSPTDRRTAGLQAQADYWAGRGNTKRSNELLDQVDQMGLRKMQLDQLKEQATERGRVNTARTEFEKRVKDPAAYIADLFNRDVIGSQDMAGKKVEYKPTKTGVMAWVVDADGTPVGQAKHYDMDEVKNQAFTHYLEQTDPKTAAMWQHQLRQDATQASRWNREFDHKKTVDDETARRHREQHAESMKKLEAYTRAASARTEGNPLSKAKAAQMEKVDTIEGEFYTALQNGDFSTARSLAGQLGTSFDNRGTIKMKKALPDGSSEEVLANKYELLVDQAHNRAAMAQGSQIKAGLQAAFPKAVFDGVGVDLESGKQVVIVGKKEVPLDKFVAEQEKKTPTARGLGPATRSAPSSEASAVGMSRTRAGTLIAPTNPRQAGYYR